MDRALSPTAGSACPSRLGGTYPELRRADWDQKKRAYSYHRFDNEICGPASIGGTSFGHIEIDLKWNFRQSQWGCIEGDRPAGILYLDIGLHSHGEYKLASINVEVTLEDVEADPSGAAVAGNAPKNTAKTKVQMTDWFGPKHILGREHPQLVTKESKLQPSFEGFGFGFGGVGSSVQKVTPINSRWELAGRLKRPDRWKNHLAGGRHYKVAAQRLSLVFDPNKSLILVAMVQTLQWTVTENELESARNNTIRVAFTFEHGGQPFHMHAKVDGTLMRKRDRFVNRLKDLRFGPRRDRPGDVSTTYIGTYNGNRKPLDELAKGLDLAMQEKNWKSRPTEIPEPEQATFGEIQPHPDPLLTPSSHETEQAQQARNPTRPVVFDQFMAQELACFGHASLTKRQAKTRPRNPIPLLQTPSSTWFRRRRSSCDWPWKSWPRLDSALQTRREMRQTQMTAWGPQACLAHPASRTSVAVRPWYCLASRARLPLQSSPRHCRHRLWWTRQTRQPPCMACPGPPKRCHPDQPNADQCLGRT